jgi:hypothetical protein
LRGMGEMTGVLDTLATARYGEMEPFDL